MTEHDHGAHTDPGTSFGHKTRPEAHEVHGASAGHDANAAPAAGHADHDRHSGHSVAMFRDKFWLSLALTVPVIFWSHDPQKWLGYAAPTFLGLGLIPPVLGTIGSRDGGLVFMRGPLGERAGR